MIGAQVLCVFGRDRLFAVESHALPGVVAPAGGSEVLPLEEHGAIAFHAVDVATEDHSTSIARPMDVSCCASNSACTTPAR